MRQSTRLIFTLGYLVLLILLARFVTGSWFYIPPGDAGVWFQAGLLMVVLGSFFIEQHFTKPVDVVANVAAATITLLALEHRDHFLFWGVTLTVIVLVGVAAFASMAIQSFARSERLLKFGNFLFTVSTFVGSAKRLFSVVLILAVFSYFQIPSTSALLILLFWAVVVVSEPVGIPGFIDKLIEAGRRKSGTIGRVWRVVGSNIVQIELLSDVELTPDNVLKISVGNQNLYAAPLGSFSLKDKRILNAITMQSPSGDVVSMIKNAGSVKLTPSSEVPTNVSQSKAFQGRDKIVGFVDDNSDIEELHFKLLSDFPLREGYLVKVFIDDKSIIYQVVNAITRSESHEGDEDQFILVIAQQVGSWRNETCRFESVDWVAKPGSPVYVESEVPVGGLAIAETRKVVGKLPNSQYPIHVDVNEIVTHHTAVLGITGSGKTFLAYELIRKMVESGIKVLVFDISADYAKDLAALNPSILTTTGDIPVFLADGNHKLGIAQFQPTAGATLVKATAVSVGHVLTWAKTNLTTQQGENIEAKVCVVFEEAHSLIPEWNTVSIQSDRDEVNKISQAILQGRKYGVGALVVTQRTANITKTILNQCNTIFALQSFDQTGLEFLKNYIGEEHAHALSTLLPRHAVLFGKASSSRRPVIVRLSDGVVRPPASPPSTASTADAAVPKITGVEVEPPA